MATNTEQEIRADLSKEVPWDLVKMFSTTVRESGTEGEWKAARYIFDKLKGWGCDVTMHTPELLIRVARSWKFRDWDRFVLKRRRFPHRRRASKRKWFMLRRRRWKRSRTCSQS